MSGSTPHGRDELIRRLQTSLHRHATPFDTTHEFADRVRAQRRYRATTDAVLTAAVAIVVLAAAAVAGANLFAPDQRVDFVAPPPAATPSVAPSETPPNARPSAEPSESRTSAPSAALAMTPPDNGKATASAEQPPAPNTVEIDGHAIAVESTCGYETGAVFRLADGRHVVTYDGDGPSGLRLFPRTGDPLERFGVPLIESGDDVWQSAELRGIEGGRANVRVLRSSGPDAIDSCTQQDNAYIRWQPSDAPDPSAVPNVRRPLTIEHDGTVDLGLLYAGPCRSVDSIVAILLESPWAGGPTLIIDGVEGQAPKMRIAAGADRDADVADRVAVARAGSITTYTGTFATDADDYGVSTLTLKVPNPTYRCGP